MKGYKKIFIAAFFFSVVLSGIYALSFAGKANSNSGILIPWRSAIAGFIGFSVLFLLVKQKQLVVREKNCFSSAYQKEGMLAAVREGVRQLLLAGCIFLLFGILGVFGKSLYLLVFFGTTSIILAVLVSQTKIPHAFSMVVPLLGYAVFVAYSLYILTMHGYSGWSPEGREIFIPVAKAALNWIWAAELILVIAEFWKKEEQVWIIILYGILLYLVFRTTERPLLLGFAALTLLSNLWKKPRTTARIVLGLLLAYVGFLAVALATGWVEYRTFYFEYAGWIPAYGMGHSNLPALVIMSVLLLVWYLWLKDCPFVTAAVFWLAAPGTWFMTYCRTVVITLAVFPLLNLYRVVLCKRKKTKGISLLCWLPMIIATASVIGVFWIPTQTLFPIEDSFFVRFTIPYNAVQTTGIHLFGNRFDVWPIIDNVFLHMLVFYGPVSLVLITGLFMWTGWRYYRNRQYAELILLTIFMIYSFMENAMIHMPFGYAVLLAGPWPRGGLKKRKHEAGNG